MKGKPNPQHAAPSTQHLSPLPIDAVLPQLKSALADHAACVLQAPPGAGKTTRVPLALLPASWLAGKSIVMLEPRRLAATNAARYLASQLGERVGQTVGYAIRYQRQISRATRIEVVTEGILTRRLQADPELSGVGLVIFDEFHERNLHSDLALALCRDAQLGLRDDLKILIMSATLDGAPLARLLGDAPTVTSAGRAFPVAVRYLETDPQQPCAEAVARGVRRALAETDGDILAFLPGAGEIRRCQALLEPAVGPVLLCPLYGNLPFAAQERAMVPAGQRRVVLATNIAETSLTIDGITVVVDSGWERRPRFDAARGTTTLESVRISSASATQRAGRAGRLGPGICYRLWSAGTDGTLLPYAPPEILVADLAPLALELARWGVTDPQSLAWLDPPPAGHLAAARLLLRRLGALDSGERLTRLGEAMAALPAHPRLARLLIEGQRSGAPALGCELAALLEERDLFRRGAADRHATDSDVMDRLEALQRWRQRPGGGGMLDADAVAAVERAANAWRRVLKCGNGAEASGSVSMLARLLAVAYPDRIALERQEGSGRYLLSGGQGARLSPRSRVHKAPLLVAVELEGQSGGEGLIHSASALPRDVLDGIFAEQLVWRRQVEWDVRQQRVVAREEERLGELVLASRPVPARPDELAIGLLHGLRQLGLEVLGWSRGARELLARGRFVRRIFPDEEWPDLSDAALLAGLEDWLAPFLAGVTSRAALERFDPLAALRARFDYAQLQRLEQLAPESLPVPSGSKIRLDYAADGPPVLAVKLQELFGLADTPRIAAGKVAVVLHLLSPARRPVAVTQDLRSFWDRIYPQVKKELKGRYPKHPWPDDPWTAPATRRTK